MSSPAHYAASFPGYGQLKRTEGPTLPLSSTAATITTAASNMQPPASSSYADSFRRHVDDYIKTTQVDFTTAWTACQRLYPDLWQNWQGAAKAANEAGQTAPADTTKRRADALAEFTKRVSDRMKDSGDNYPAAWSFVQQTQLALYKKMHGDFSDDTGK